MKRCSKCPLEYEGNTLEFCLQDGSRLVSSPDIDFEIPTVAHVLKNKPTTEKTVSLPFPAASPQNSRINRGYVDGGTLQSEPIKQSVVEQSRRFLEKLTIVVALAHNWWQWIYLNNQSYTSFSGYVFSANFLIWLILLIAGALLGTIGFKRATDRSFAIIGLIILAVNFILFLAPKR